MSLNTIHENKIIAKISRIYSIIDINLLFYHYSTQKLAEKFDSNSAIQIDGHIILLWAVNYTKKHIVSTVNDLKFLTLFSFCSQTWCELSGLEFTKRLSEQQTVKTLTRLLPLQEYFRKLWYIFALVECLQLVQNAVSYLSLHICLHNIKRQFGKSTIKNQPDNPKTG